jgi:hypothetical protein
MIRFRTFTGGMIDLEEPQANDICLEDIAKGLSNVCRFAGQLHQFYSVAQHCVLVASLVPSHLKFHAILHDATEAYLGDVSRGLKHSHFMAGYRTLEERLDRLIHSRFGIEPLPHGWDHIKLKAADDLAAIYEARTLRESRPYIDESDIQWAIDCSYVGSSPHQMRALLPHVPNKMISPWTPHEAEVAYLLEFARTYNLVKESV